MKTIKQYGTVIQKYYLSDPASSFGSFNALDLLNLELRSGSRVERVDVFKHKNTIVYAFVIVWDEEYYEEVVAEDSE